MLNYSIIAEFQEYAENKVTEEVLTAENFKDWHFHLFNENYYIVGCFEAEKWLESHNINAFEAIEYCQEYEQDHFGETYKTYDNAKTTVNMLVYILGGEWLSDGGAEYIQKLILDNMREDAIIVTDRASLRSIDLLDSWFGYISERNELAQLDSAAYKAFEKAEVGELEPFLMLIGDEAATDLTDRVFDVMCDLAPEGYYFGASEGDGTLFGYWLDEDSVFE